MNILGRIESNAVNVVAQIGPWLAPIPTAFMAYRTGLEILGWPVAVALAGALALEILGVATTSTALMLRDYNATRRKYPDGMTVEERRKSRMIVDPTAPAKLAYTLAGVYLVSAMLVVLLVDVLPGVIRWVPGLFPLVSLTGAVTIAVRADHRRRLETIAVGNADRKGGRNKPAQKRNKAARQPARAGTDAKQEAETQPAYAGTGDGTRGRARAILAERPGISGSELGRQLGRSERLGRKLKAELTGTVPAQTGTVAGGNGREAS